MLNKYDKQAVIRILFLLIIFFFGSSSVIAGKTQEKEYIEEHVNDIESWSRVSHPVFIGFVLDMGQHYFFDFFKKKMREVLKIYKNTALHHTSDNEYFACRDDSVSQGRCAGIKNHGENETKHSQSAGDSFGVNTGGALAGYGVSTGGAMGKKIMLASGVTVLKFFGNAPPKGKSHPGVKGSKSKPWPPGEIGKLDDISKYLK